MGRVTTIKSANIVGFSLAIVLIMMAMVVMVKGTSLNPYSVKISTFAGGNGEFKDPQKLARLSNGDILVTDALGHAIKKINGTGVITTIAGTGVAGFAGDNGPAINAQVNKPYGIAVSSNDEIYFADSMNHRIRKIDITGNITTVVGTGANTFSGDGGLATDCTMNTPMDVSLSASGELYIADMYNYRIRKVLTNGTIVTFAGNGQSGHIGDGGLATNAAMALAYGVKVFSNGEVYISDSFNFKVRKVDVNGNITTVAGSGAGPFNGDNVLATAANLNHPTDVLRLDTGELIIADTDNYRIRLVMPNGTIITTAGNGTASFSDGEIAEENGLSLPTGLLMIQNGLLIADAGNKRIRLLQSRIYSCYGKSYLDSSVCSGQGQCVGNNMCQCNAGFEGPTCLPSSYYITTVARGLKDPQKISKLSNGDLIVSDTGDHSIKKISYSTGVVTRIAGTGVAGFSGDGGLATLAQFNKPYGIAVTINDEIYIADSLNHRIRFIDVNGNISTVVGTSIGFSGDGGLATAAKLNAPMDVSLSASGDLYIADRDNYRIRKVLANGTIVTFAGNGQSGHIGDGGQAISAALSQAYGVRVVNDEVYISDSNNFKVRKIDVSGVITTIAGTGAGPFNGDNVLATAANLNHPTDVAFLSNGEMLIADTDNNRVRMVLTNGTIVSIAGNGTASFSDGRIATSRGLSLPTGILVVSDDEIYIADAKNGRIRLLSSKFFTCNGIDQTETSVCSGHGSCVSKDNCVCKQGWSGANCDTTIQAPQCANQTLGINIPCSGHGTCANGVCTCSPDFYGSYCSLSVMISSKGYTHPMMGVFMMAIINSLTLDGISNVDYSWSQISGPTISNLASMTNLNTPTLIIPGKFNALSFNNGLVSGSTYGFALTAKITTGVITTTVTTSTTVFVQQNPTLTFTLHDDSTNQAVTSGVAGTTVFRINITRNSNPYSDSSFKYGFGFSDSSSITILTDMSEGPATFKLPFISGQSSVDIYVRCEGDHSDSVQKLTTISLTNPVSNLPPSQAISTIQNLFTSNSSVADLLGAASLLNTITTTDSTQIANKQSIRNSIITTISKAISSGDLGSAIKALSTVTSVTSEITKTSADNTLDTMISGTTNPQFSRNEVDALVNIASNIVTVSSSSKTLTFGNAMGSKLVAHMSLGDLVSSSGANFGIAVSKGVSSLSLSNVSIALSPNSRSLAGIECYFIVDIKDTLGFLQCLANSNWVARTGPKYAPGTERAIGGVTYSVGSLIYDMTPMYDNGTIVSGNVTSLNDIQITIPYTGSLTPVCGIHNSDDTYSVNTKATLIKGSGSVTCKTKVLRGNVLLLATQTTTDASVTPKKSTVLGGAETNKLSAFLMCLLLLAMLLF
ncbi:predicted protein [Naegleria gruberi]|uniref:Predicted protein n=1 Tax=Naegleria gruberi TaxID=5762 RepID=D2VAP7_NAEGR|nr:uncharacterized protein NAEGRDRAFT_48007 [Naegleria gruberi]EFC45990.1 predicted protein [Naegleria gruberi]|eukprot:XP_002678734.1 predicted protein [Naegleria gruberi strain NEG-M]